MRSCTTIRSRGPSRLWPFGEAGVPSRYNRRWTVAAGADDRLPALIVSFIFHWLVRAGQPDPGMPAPWCDPFGSCVIGPPVPVFAPMTLQTCTSVNAVNRHNPRSFVRTSGFRRNRDMGATNGLTRADHGRPLSASADAAVLRLLSDLLIEDSVWTMAEVQRLVSMRDLAELGRWRVSELDDAGPSAR